ncbi:hypothetical protein K456DRAFT_1072597 [Colletotrichum gloeosporioides 23]|nr:hypothetical protein K456DRAFT_1072597 [Colletotrichum gloeosporioides 23]
MEGAPLLGLASGGRVAHGHCGAGTDAQTPTSKGADPSSDTGPDPFKVRFPYAQRKQLGTYLSGILGPRQSRGGLQQRRRVRCPSSLARLDWPLRTPGPAIVIVSPPAKHQPYPPQPPLTTSNPTNLRIARNERAYQLGKGRKVHLRPPPQQHRHNPSFLQTTREAIVRPATPTTTTTTKRSRRSRPPTRTTNPHRRARRHPDQTSPILSSLELSVSARTP